MENILIQLFEQIKQAFGLHQSVLLIFFLFLVFILRDKIDAILLTIFSFKKDLKNDNEEFLKVLKEEVEDIKETHIKILELVELFNRHKTTEEIIEKDIEKNLTELKLQLSELDKENKKDLKEVKIELLNKIEQLEKSIEKLAKIIKKSSGIPDIEE